MTSRHEEQLGSKIGEIARLWRIRMDERLRPLGLSQARWMVILHLSKNPDGMPQTELAARMGISHASLSPQINRLVEDGWVERRERESDRRSKTIHPTEQTKALSREINHTAAKLRSEFFEGLSDEDLRHCDRVLTHILQRAQSL